MERRGGLDPATLTEVLALAAAAADTDGVEPLPEQVVLRLRDGGDPGATQLLTRDPDGQLTGYAHLIPTGSEVTGELVVHPDTRGRGLGRALVDAAQRVTAEGDLPGRRLSLWAHGDHPAAAALARSTGLRRGRVLLQLRRSLAEPVTAPQLPTGITLRAFRPGSDDADWLALNARAFADHPEQGRWQEPELRARMAEPWFDPAGFLLAVRTRDDAPVGFHWTKIHPADRGYGPDPIGEVYVLGVDPAAQGLGLGAALTLAGLAYLRERGLPAVMLYVDESNPGAVALYTKLGFARWSADVTYGWSSG